jgi:acyl-CoA thioester hydrolase
VGTPFRHRLRVRYAECDAQGVVFNAHYLTYMDVGITELWREAGIDYVQMVERGADQVVAEARLRYLAPARFDEELDLEVVVTRLGTTGMTTEVSMLAAADARVLVRGEIRHVFVDPATAGKLPIPDYIRQALAPHARVEREGAPAQPAS